MVLLVELYSTCISKHYIFAALVIRESAVDSLCRDGADAQYMQYLAKAV